MTLCLPPHSVPSTPCRRDSTSIISLTPSVEDLDGTVVVTSGGHYTVTDGWLK